MIVFCGILKTKIKNLCLNYIFSFQPTYILNSGLLKESQPINSYKLHACLHSNVSRDKFCLSSHVYMCVCI